MTIYKSSDRLYYGSDLYSIKDTTYGEMLFNIDPWIFHAWGKQTTGLTLL